MISPSAPDSLLHLSQQIESLLVARNPRGMQTLQRALQPGYYARAVQLIDRAFAEQDRPCILIGTGFPVVGTFETDGPVGAIALWQTLQTLGAEAWLVCGEPLASALQTNYPVYRLSCGDRHDAEQETAALLLKHSPQLVISIEQPGQARDGRYYNMRGIDISAGVAPFDPVMRQATCPTIAIGDGGNEIGMGIIEQAVSALAITPATTGCDELLLADVSNWAAHGLIALLGWQRQQDLLAAVDPVAILRYLSQRGSVDGVTHRNELTEDGLDATIGLQLIRDLRQLCNPDG